MFDSHCHLDFEALAPRLQEHLGEARRAGVSAWFVPGVTSRTWRGLKDVEGLSPSHIFIGVGQHPYWSSEIQNIEEFSQELRSASRNLGAVAIGECGLDKKRGGELEHQIGLFEAHLAVARELQLPLVIHQVGAREEMMKSIKRVGLPDARGIVHGFSGDENWGRALTSRGFKLGIGPAVTKTHRKRLRETVVALELDDFVLETDAPDQSVRSGDLVGRPIDLVAVCQEIAQLRQCDEEQVGACCSSTARRIFGV